MRFDLRRLLRSLALAGIPAAAAGCVEAVIDDDCADTVERSFEIPVPAAPALQFQIDRCHIDRDACIDLCAQSLEQDFISETPTRCEVDFSDSSVEVRVWFEVFTGGGCSDGIDGPVPSF